MSLPDKEIYNSCCQERNDPKVDLPGVTRKAKAQVVESLTEIQRVLIKNQSQEEYRMEGIIVKV